MPEAYRNSETGQNVMIDALLDRSVFWLKLCERVGSCGTKNGSGVCILGCFRFGRYQPFGRSATIGAHAISHTRGWELSRETVIH